VCLWTLCAVDFSKFLPRSGFQHQMRRLVVDCVRHGGTGLARSLPDRSVTSTSSSSCWVLISLSLAAGIPCLFFYVLYTHRRVLRNPAVSQKFGFLYEVSVGGFGLLSCLLADLRVLRLCLLQAFDGGCWWFELADMGHKLFLTGVSTLLPSRFVCSRSVLCLVCR
jgi:hypothetical protein